MKRRTAPDSDNMTRKAGMPPTPSSNRKSKVKAVPDFSKLHQKWESKLQKGKACTKKPCTVTQEKAKEVMKELQQEEVFGNIIPVNPPEEDATSQRMQAAYTPRHSRVPEKAAFYTDCPRYTRHTLAEAMNRQFPDAAAKGRAPTFGGCVVGVPQRQSIYRSYVHTGLQPMLVGTPDTDSASYGALKARGTRSELKVRRVPLDPKSPGKSPALRNPMSAQRRSKALTPGRVANTETPGRASASRTRRVLAADTGQMWQNILQPLSLTDNTPKDALATRLFTSETENDCAEKTSPKEANDLMALEDMEAELDKDLHRKQPLRERNLSDDSPFTTPTKQGEGTPKRQRHSSGDGKEFISSTKRSRVLQNLSPNIELVDRSPSSIKLSVGSPLGGGRSPASGQKLRPYEGVSPARRLQGWAVCEEDKENVTPLRNFSPQQLKKRESLLNCSVSDLNQSLCESVLEMETLESEAELLRKQKVENLSVEGSILTQLEEVRRKQEKLTKMQQQLMLQLKLQRSAAGSGKKSKRKKSLASKPDLSPLVEKEKLSFSESPLTRDEANSPAEAPAVPQAAKPEKRVTFSETMETKTESMVTVAPLETREPEAKQVQDIGAKPNVGHMTSSFHGNQPSARMPLQPISPCILSPTPHMRGTAQLLGNVAPMPRPFFRSPSSGLTAFSGLAPPIQTPLALQCAADRAKVLLDRQPGISPDIDSADSSSAFDGSSLVSSPELTPIHSNSPVQYTSPSTPCQPSVAHPRVQYFTGQSPGARLLGTGSMSLMGSLYPTPRPSVVPPQSLVTNHDKRCSVAEVADRYRDALLDQEVALYTGRVGMRLGAESDALIDRCMNPIGKVLQEGDDTHFMPIHCPSPEAECIPRAGSAFGQYTVRHI